MIEGIGVDIIKISRIASIIEQFGERFVKRILVPTELSIYNNNGHSASFLAKRFAAKEAAAKALGTGIGKVSFQHLEISNNNQGAPILTMHGHAAELKKQRGITQCHLTISDETDNAVAFVVLEST